MKNTFLFSILLLGSAVHALEVHMNCIRSAPRERVAVTVLNSWIGIERTNFASGVKTEIQGYRIEMTDQHWVFQVENSLQVVTIPAYVLFGASGKGFISIDSVRFHCLIRRLGAGVARFWRSGTSRIENRLQIFDPLIDAF